jgi:ATP-dependent helicase/nuclease subunit A
LFDGAHNGPRPVEGPIFEGAQTSSERAEPDAVQHAAVHNGSLVEADATARQFAVDPGNNVVLEASAGTGKTSVLVTRYVNLLKAGAEPANILAMTFTRKAAAEMRERIVRELRESAARSEFDRARWLDLRDHFGEIAISTIDAFCLSLLREFPLEADIDPGFDIADETEIPRLVEEALDRSLRILTSLAREEPDIALVLAQLGVARTREGLATLLERRLVAWDALNRFLAHGPSDVTAAAVCRRAAVALHDALRTVPGGLAQFLSDGPIHHPRYELFLREVRSLPELEDAPDAVVRGRLERIAAHFLTQEGKPRVGGTLGPYKGDHYPSADAARRHRAAVFQMAPQIERVVFAFNRGLNVILARGIRRMFAIALTQYRRALEERSVLDFSDVLERALELLRRMDEFSQSRFRLEARYHHVLVDEFQDTSRAQWELVSLLIQSWGEGLGLATHPSIFIVGDRKQSIYRFRDAEVAVLQEAGRHIESLRPGGSARRSISRSFRAVPELLAFVNDVFTEMGQRRLRADDFAYADEDRFPIPVDGSPRAVRGPALGVAVGNDPAACAAAVADEIARVLRDDTVRDRATGAARQTRPGDIAILFRSRSSHREFERELALRGIPTYVYKGLGFFDADEIKDVMALLRYLADPESDLRAAAFLRSRVVRLSDAGLARLAPRLAASLTGAPDDPLAALDEEDRLVLTHVRKHVPAWLARVDVVPPADLLEQLLRESAYAYELRGARRRQAWENLKKMRGLIRRIQNRGYATLGRIADHIDALTAGDESNAVLEALDAVNLMTVHAAKGLEFPIVFVVNLGKGASGPPKPIRVTVDGDEMPSVSIGPFVSEMEEADRERERHETRRLLYVALTRARDRLYLSSVLKDGMLVPGRGSLAEVLPDSLKALFAHAATAFPEMSSVAWTGQSGRSFEWRLVRGSDLDSSANHGGGVPPGDRP